jgi:glycosyltransferase involved in cell wall biosynthesis
MPRPNAALYYVPSGYSAAGPRPLGIQAAGEGLLRAMALHAGAERLIGFGEVPAHGEDLRTRIAAIAPGLPVEWVPTTAPERLADPGTLLLPGPGLGEYAWMRRRAGATARFSLCGVTHTTATARVLDDLAALLVAPVMPWDALICTSHAVARMVARVLDDQAAYLRERFGAAPAPPLLPVIPLGVHCDDFARDPVLRAAWRARLGLGEGDVAALFLGRLSFHAKAHPIPLFQAMQHAAGASRRRLALVLAGWFFNAEIEAAFRAAADAFCPDVPVIVLDATRPEQRRAAWALADLFVSPVDNIQETFGLGPVEAMAAGLPCVVSDWDGYRDTVRDGIDGFRAPTIAPPEGVCAELAARYAARIDDYDRYIGAVSQTVAVHVPALSAAIAALAADPARREAMGQAAAAHARAQFDWRVVIARYQALWDELAARRAAAAPTAPADPTWPARPDPFRAFAAYPTRSLAPDMLVRRTARPAVAIDVLLASPSVAFGQAGLPAREDLLALLPGETPIRVASLAAALPQARRAEAWRALLWLAKYDLVAMGAAD